jgi:N-acetylglucosamine-6-sulfatase
MSIAGLTSRILRARKSARTALSPGTRVVLDHLDRRGAVAVASVSIVANLAILSGGATSPATEGWTPHRMLSGYSTTASAGRPNIVLFLADDMRAEDLRYLPHVQRLLIDKGVTFSRAFATNSLCCPARATLLTGMYSHNHRVMGNTRFESGGWSTFERLHNQHNLLPVWLQQAGYRTWHAGKHLNGFRSLTRQPGWDYWSTTIKDIYNYENWGASVQGRYVEHTNSYQELVTRRSMVRYIKRWAPSRHPFFMWVGSLAPHGEGGGLPPVPEPKYRTTMPDLPLALSPSIAEADVSDKPPWTALEPNHMGIKRARAELLVRIRALLSVDDTVAAAVRNLKATHDYANTVFIFMSDNGFSVGEHRHHGKNVAYEEAIGMPLVIAGPGFAPGTTFRKMVSQVDIPATIVDLANARRGLDADGISLARLRTTDAIRPRRVLPIEGGTWGVPKERTRSTDRLRRFYWGARWSHYLYVEYAPGFREFYDLLTDPYQLENAYRPRAQATRIQLALMRWVHRHKNCEGHECSKPLALR